MRSVKSHIENLSSKHYSANPSLNAPDFVALFLPIEPALGVALKAEPDLYYHASKQRIVIVTPATLIATLKTVQNLWQLHQQTQSHAEIFELAAKLYDKFVGFTETLMKVRKQFDSANSGFEKAFAQLSDGKGNLVRTTERLKEMGVRTKKEISEELLDARSIGLENSDLEESDLDPIIATESYKNVG